MYFRWGEFAPLLQRSLKQGLFPVVLTPDAEDATYLNATELKEVYKQSDDDNGKPRLPANRLSL